MGPAWRRKYYRYKRLFLNFFAQYKEKQDVKMFLEVLLSLATISFFSLLALRPTVITIAELIKEIESKKETVAEMEAKIQSLERARAIYNQEEGRIKLLETSIPKEPSPDSLVRQIEGLSGKHAASISSLSVGQATLRGKDKPAQTNPAGGSTLGAASELSFSLNSTAEYPSLFNLLSDLEKTRRPIKFGSISINTTNIEGEKTLILVLGGKTPYLKRTIQPANQ